MSPKLLKPLNANNSGVGLGFVGSQGGADEMILITPLVGVKRTHRRRSSSVESVMSPFYSTAQLQHESIWASGAKT